MLTIMTKAQNDEIRVPKKKNTKIAYNIKKFLQAIQVRAKRAHKSTRAAVRYSVCKFSKIIKMCNSDQSKGIEAEKFSGNSIHAETAHAHNQADAKESGDSIHVETTHLYNQKQTDAKASGGSIHVKPAHAYNQNQADTKVYVQVKVEVEIKKCENTEANIEKTRKQPSKTAEKTSNIQEAKNESVKYNESMHLLLIEAIEFMRQIENIIKSTAYMKKAEYLPVILFFYLKSRNYKLSSKLEKAKAIFHSSKSGNAESVSLADISCTKINEDGFAEELKLTDSIACWISCQKLLKEAYTSFYETIVASQQHIIRKENAKTHKTIVFYRALLKYIQNTLELKLQRAKQVADSDCYSETPDALKLAEVFDYADTCECSGLKEKADEETGQKLDYNEISDISKLDEVFCCVDACECSGLKEKANEKTGQELDYNEMSDAPKSTEVFCYADACECFGLKKKADEEADKEADKEADQELNTYNKYALETEKYEYTDDEADNKNNIVNSEKIMAVLMTSPLFQKQREKNIYEGTIEQKNMFDKSPEKTRETQAAIQYIRKVGMPTHIVRCIMFDKI